MLRPAHLRLEHVADTGRDPLVEQRGAQLGFAGKGREPGEPIDHVPMTTHGKSHRTPVYDREALTRAAVVDGPVIIKETTATTVVEPGWRASVDARSNLILERISPLPSLAAVSTDVNPIMLEVFNNVFMAVAEEMGLALQNTASSVNMPRATPL